LDAGCGFLEKSVVQRHAPGRIAPDLSLVKRVVSGQAIITVFCVGAALLGFWLAVRFPERGPQRLTSGFFAIAVSMAALSLTAPLVRMITGGLGAYGPAFGLLFVVLPALTAVFWAAACMIRTVTSLISVR
jgi:hypothetical protein